MNYKPNLAGPWVDVRSFARSDKPRDNYYSNSAHTPPMSTLPRDSVDPILSRADSSVEARCCSKERPL